MKKARLRGSSGQATGLLPGRSHGEGNRVIVGLAGDSGVLAGEARIRNRSMAQTRRMIAVPPNTAKAGSHFKVLAQPAMVNVNESPALRAVVS